MVTADHGPAVSGAHNTIVTARAGKDLVSCLTSGLLTIVRGSIYIPQLMYIQHMEKRCAQSKPSKPWIPVSGWLALISTMYA